MGTSIVHASPRTPSWKVVAAGYQNDQVPTTRIVEELWRAAFAPAEGNWYRRLQTPAVLGCLSIALESREPTEAVSRAYQYVARSGGNSIAVELAFRAIPKAFADVNRTRGFTLALFREATSYLVSRDLSGYIGPKGRVRSARESIAFKRELMDRILDRIGDLEMPLGIPDEAGWGTIVAHVADRLGR